MLPCHVPAPKNHSRPPHSRRDSTAPARKVTRCPPTKDAVSPYAGLRDSEPAPARHLLPVRRRAAREIASSAHDAPPDASSRIRARPPWTRKRCVYMRMRLPLCGRRAHFCLARSKRPCLRRIYAASGWGHGALYPLSPSHNDAGAHTPAFSAQIGGSD
ncbi:hypothetical protein B0H17DRAFT_1217924 [Mycena rosella]|uniref:Uncharacterized protein n=1 Tax=Mycena rosella TaxID=1033263 RepID=A0AAD7BVC3_MYCRO|nr:hypothetical protein B0H17DRAFT_1217924 [Mycena rosella]